MRIILKHGCDLLDNSIWEDVEHQRRSWSGYMSTLKEVLSHIYRFCQVSYEFEQNPLSVLRRLFPEFKWLFVSGDEFDVKAAMAYDANYIIQDVQSSQNVSQGSGNGTSDVIIARRIKSKIRVATYAVDFADNNDRILEKRGYRLIGMRS